MPCRSSHLHPHFNHHRGKIISRLHRASRGCSGHSLTTTASTEDVYVVLKFLFICLRGIDHGDLIQRNVNLLSQLLDFAHIAEQDR